MIYNDSQVTKLLKITHPGCEMILTGEKPYLVFMDLVIHFNGNTKKYVVSDEIKVRKVSHIPKRINNYLKMWQLTEKGRLNNKK